MRKFILGLLWWSGFMWWWRFVHRHHVIILTVHGVMDAGVKTTWVPLRPRLSRGRLDACIGTLSRYYRWVSLPDAVEMLAGRQRMRPYSLVLTFDDGYRNHLAHALPILRRHGVPATFFIATGHIDERKPFWFDRLDYALQQVRLDRLDVQVGAATICLGGGDRATLEASYQRLRDASKALPRDDREMLREMEALAARLEEESGRRLADIFEQDDWSAVLTWEDIEDAAAGDVCIGSHTVDHIRLGVVDAATMAEQLTRSRQAIEAHRGEPCRHFCYPSGSFTRQAADAARACGYESAVTSEEGTNRAGDDVLTLRRIDLPANGSRTELLATVSGLLGALSGWKRRLLNGKGTPR
jgi:Polysaccharide deacetylase